MKYPKVPEDIKSLMGLVKAGRFFEVQKWIADGKATEPPEPFCYSPLRTAVESGFFSMIQILLPLAKNEAHKRHLFRQAVWNGNLELVKLFLEHGIDIRSVEGDMCAVFETGDATFISFFLDSGLDVTKGDPFARALRTPIKPLLGVYLVYREKIPDLTRQLNVALRHHTKEGNLGSVCLLLWAGASPNVPVPEIGEDADPESDMTALEVAVFYGRQSVVDKIGLKHKDTNLNRLLARACSNTDWPLIERLLDLGADPKGDPEYSPLDRLLWHLDWKIDPPFGERRDWEIDSAISTLLKFVDRCGGLAEGQFDKRTGLRRALYKWDPKRVDKLLTQFLNHEVCPPSSLLNFINTPKMKTVLGERYNRLVQAIQRKAATNEMSTSAG
jgi:hypothetical protein